MAVTRIKVQLLKRLCRSTAVLMLVTSPAKAHLISTGLGPFYDGASHFLRSADLLAPVLGLAVLAGMHGPQHARWLLFTLTVAWILGASVPAPMAAYGLPLPWTAGSCMLIGLLIATDRSVSPIMLSILAGVLGCLGGVACAVGENTQPTVLQALGVGAAVFVLTALLASIVIRVHAYWLRMTMRVAGSWLAAVGLLVVGWTLHAQ
jgi:hydrogenase/urease accessory protein HupE